MRWRKLGLLIATPAPIDWGDSHAMVPVAEARGATVRVYFSARDAEGCSSTGFADFDPADPDETLRFGASPLLRPGALGAFDDSGAMGASVVRVEGRTHLYYIGWSRGVSVPFYTFIGCAVSADAGRSFRRISEAPVVERGPHDPFLTTSPWVLVEDGVWRMWYASGTGWAPGDDRPRHFYNIKYAESDDGIAWRRTGVTCIDFADESEYAIARPCVVRDGDVYRMWYSYRGDAYRIGFAESRDGIEWERKDAEAGIDMSAEGWDSEMIGYPCVFDYDGMRYMLYNGNGYGASGIGLALLQRDD
jgi:hypothetical protein